MSNEKITEPIFSTNKKVCNGKMGDVFYGKSKIWLNKTTLDSGHLWERKIIQDKDWIHAYSLNKNLEN